MAENSIQVAAWTRYPWLRHGFSTRFGGVSTVYGSSELNLGFTAEDDRSSVEQNRELLLEALGAPRPLATVRQVHGAAVRVLRAMPAMESPAVEADAQITSLPGVTLGILTADCVPILLADTRQRIVAAVHAGWRGTAAGVVERTVQAMQSELGSVPDDLVAAVGPAIGPCCYRVGADLRSVFAPELFHRREDGLALDLWQANRQGLLRAGVPDAAIRMESQCTACTRLHGRRRYFSHRAEQGRTGRMMAAIAVQTEPDTECNA